MVDIVDARQDGVLDPLRALGVGASAHAGVPCFFDESADLVHAVLAGGGFVLFGHDTAGRKDLEHVGPFAQLLAGCLAHLGHAVRQPGHLRAPVPLGRHKVHVAVTGRLRDDHPGRHDAGPDGCALLDGPFDIDRQHAPRVAHGGKAGI